MEASGTEGGTENAAYVAPNSQSPSLQRMPHPSNFHQRLGTASSDRSLSQTSREELFREARRLRVYRVAIDARCVDA
jgi:hypothetical protein